MVARTQYGDSRKSVGQAHLPRKKENKQDAIELSEVAREHFGTLLVLLLLALVAVALVSWFLTPSGLQFDHVAPAPAPTPGSS